MTTATLTQDTPISFGLALEALRGHRMQQVGKARRELRELRNNPMATSMQIELAEAALEDACDAATRSQRVSDAEARTILQQEGIPLCRG